MQTHAFTLNSPWYELVKQGKKTYEGRRNTEKIRNIREGDVIEFRHHTDTGLPPIVTRVQSVIFFPTFLDALELLPLQQVLPLPDMSIKKGVEIYHQFVSEDTQERDGVAMIKIVVIEKPTLSYDTELKLFRIYCRSGITDQHASKAKSNGWVLARDGHASMYGLLNAPADAAMEVAKVFDI